MATAGQHGNVLDMIALDAGEAADFLAGLSATESGPAGDIVLRAGASAARGPVPERGKALASHWLKRICVSDLVSKRKGR